tara:strand:- start:95 stop:298 length:204 start_codon:yes stop_codon:yes gene_type:complete
MKLKNLLKEADTTGPGWDMARALNSLANDIDNSKHDKQLKWAEKNERLAGVVIKKVEELNKFVQRMK